MPSAFPTCEICQHEAPFLGPHLEQNHGLSIAEYLKQHPDATVVDKAIIAKVRAEKAKVSPDFPPPPSELLMTMAEVECPVNADVPASACLPLPTNYRIPTTGELVKDIRAACIHLKNRRSTYIHGPQGSGKDGFVHAWSAYTRTPADKFQIVPGKDLQPWFWIREVSPDRGTYYREGRLLKLARDGYKTPSGRRIPALILITDFDRATKSQAEAFRLLLDTIEGGVPRWDGGSWPVFPGTLFVVTANTAGQGDETGRYVSSNIIDTTIIARFERARRFHLMEWADEEPIVRAKFPLFAERMDALLRGEKERSTGKPTTGLGIATKTLRLAVMNGELQADFSHRELCNWIGAAEDILNEHPRRVVPPRGLMREASHAVFDKFADTETRLQARRLIHGFIGDGMLDPTEVEGFEAEDLPM